MWSILSPVLIAVIGFVGVVVGVGAQQLLDVWKTNKSHKLELARRMFDTKFKVATEVSVVLHATLRFGRAWLAEAEEWTRSDERFDVLKIREQAADTFGKAYTAVAEEYDRAFGLMMFLFPPSVWQKYLHNEAGHAWGEGLREFERKRTGLKVALKVMISDERMEELRVQRMQGGWTQDVRDEIERYFNHYQAEKAELHAMLPQLQLLLAAYERSMMETLQLLRDEFRRYEE